MLQRLIYALPELSLLLGVIHLCFLYMLQEDKARVYAKISRLWLLASVFFSIIFYDKSFNDVYFTGNAWTLLFFLLAAVFAYIAQNLSSVWFAAKKETGCRYYVLMLCALAGIKLMLETINLPMLLLSYTLLIFINYRLIGISYEKYSSETSFRYFIVSAAVIVLFAGATGYLKSISNLPLNYTSIKLILEENQTSFPLFMSAVFLAVPFLYSIGIVPFHVLAEDKAGKSILPVGQYFAIVAPIAFWGAFIKLNIMVLAPVSAQFTKAYTLFALLSIGFGAIGANARINLNRVYAYAQMYYFGIILLLVSFFSKEAYFAAFLLLALSLISMNGLYLVLYGLKSRGEYLSAITSLSGLAETKPYTTGMLIISLFSLIGIPPLAGFVSQFEFVKVMLSKAALVNLGIVFFFLLFLAKASLEIIKTAYFDHKIKIYDTENKQLLFYIFLNIIAIAAVVFNPFNFMENLKDMFNVIYI